MVIENLPLDSVCFAPHCRLCERFHLLAGQSKGERSQVPLARLFSPSLVSEIDYSIPISATLSPPNHLQFLSDFKSATRGLSRVHVVESSRVESS